MISMLQWSIFFWSICSKVIDPEILPILQKEMVITLCELEIYFPPSLFDIMLHLVVHLVKETQLCGPTYMRWMYPVECYMKILKGYVKTEVVQRVVSLSDTLLKKRLSFILIFCPMCNPLDSPNLIFSKKKRR